MEKSLTLKPVSYVNGDIIIPGSKSISNRALLLAAQSTGITKLFNLLNCEDVKYMLLVLDKIGIQYKLSNNNTICEMQGIGNPLYFKTTNKEILYVGNAGTAIRPLTAALSINKNVNVILTGDARMKERPIGHLVDALIQGGAKVNYIGKKGYPPVYLEGGYTGGNIIINGNISSQFLSSLLMMAPLAPKDTYIYVNNELVSKPYIDITLKLMSSFGIRVFHTHYKFFYIQGNRQYLSPGEYFIEGDASSASYFLAAGAIRGGKVKVIGVGKNSIQGDVLFTDVLKKMGADVYIGNNYISCQKNTLNSIDIDLNHIPDAAMTVAILVLFTKSKEESILKNIYNWRVKETDRLIAMSTELRKIGATVIEGKDYLSITPPNKFKSANIETYNDHRIAMCFSLLSLSNIYITIKNPECIKKTFPNFFDCFLSLCSIN